MRDISGGGGVEGGGGFLDSLIDRSIDKLIDGIYHIDREKSGKGYHRRAGPANHPQKEISLSFGTVRMRTT